MTFLSDVEYRLLLQVNMGLVMNRMHLGFCDGGKTVRVSYSDLYFRLCIYVSSLPDMNFFFFVLLLFLFYGESDRQQLI